MTTSTRLPPPWRRLLLTVHIVASVGALGVAMVLVALGVAGLRGADPRTVYPAAHLVEAWVVAPLALLALGTGIAQTLLSRFGLVRWVTIKLIITTALTLVVFVILEPRLAAIADAATGASADPLTDAQRTQVALFPSVAVALLVLNVALGIYKPTRKDPYASRRQHPPVGSVERL